MSTVLGIFNGKGGTGKSTTTINMGAAFFLEDPKTILIDCDPLQQSLRIWRNRVDKNDYKHALPEVVVADETDLDELVRKYRKKYTYIIIDGSSKTDKVFGVMARNADVAIIPISPADIEVQGTVSSITLIKERQMMFDGLPKAYFLINKVEHGTNLAKQIRQGLLRYDIPIFKKEISDSVQHVEIYSDGTSIFQRSGGHAKVLQNEVLGVREEIKEEIYG